MLSEEVMKYGFRAMVAWYEGPLQLMSPALILSYFGVMLAEHCRVQFDSSTNYQLQARDMYQYLSLSKLRIREQIVSSSKHRYQFDFLSSSFTNKLS